jgi:hypothetical protein
MQPFPNFVATRIALLLLRNHCVGLPSLCHFLAVALPVEAAKLAKNYIDRFFPTISIGFLFHTSESIMSEEFTTASVPSGTTGSTKVKTALSVEEVLSPDNVVLTA